MTTTTPFLSSSKVPFRTEAASGVGTSYELGLRYMSICYKMLRGSIGRGVGNLNGLIATVTRLRVGSRA